MEYFQIRWCFVAEKGLKSYDGEPTNWVFYAKDKDHAEQLFQQRIERKIPKGMAFSVRIIENERQLDIIPF